MPKGVEHTMRAVDKLVVVDPRNSVMPKGVEHRTTGQIKKALKARETP